MTDEERRFMQSFCIGCALILLAVALLIVVHSCESKKMIPPQYPDPIIGIEHSLCAFCYISKTL